MFRAKISVKIDSPKKVLLEFFGTVEKNCLNETNSPPAEFSANRKLYMLLQVLIFRVVQMTKKVLVTESLLSALFWSECGKIWTRIAPKTDTFHAVQLSILVVSLIATSKLFKCWLLLRVTFKFRKTALKSKLNFLLPCLQRQPPELFHNKIFPKISQNSQENK